MHGRENTKYQVHGGWTKPISKSKGNGGITIELSINTVTLLTFILDEKAAKAFLRKVIRTNGLPDKVIIDKNGANAQALHNMNIQ